MTRPQGAGLAQRVPALWAWPTRNCRSAAIRPALVVEERKNKMFTTKEIWEAGRAALGLAPAAATPPAAVVIAPVATNEQPGVFDPIAFAFSPRVYRIHFKNGNSGEYEGAALAT